jgi:hypothetical protein
MPFVLCGEALDASHFDFSTNFNAEGVAAVRLGD